MPLTRSEVVTAGVEILDAYGLADLSMRRLADRLGVKAGALYWHVANKQSLLAAISDEILAVPEGPCQVPEQGTELGEGVRRWAHAMRRVLLAHHDGAELVASTIAVGLGQVDPAARLRAFLAEQSMSPRRASAVTRAVVHLVLGHTMDEQTRHQLHDLAVVPSVDPAADVEDFEVAVDLLVAGLRAGEAGREAAQQPPHE